MSRRSNLRQGIDRDVYHIVVKLEEEALKQSQASKNPSKTPRRLTISSIYDSIKRSNSSLARQKKRPLEDAIDRVLAVRREEAKADAQEDSDDALEAAEAVEASRRSKSADGDFSLLNRQIAKSWGFKASSTPAAQSSGDMGSTTPNNALISGVINGSLTTTNGVASGAQTPLAADRQPNGEPRPKKRKAAKEVDRSPPAGITVRDIAGVDNALKRLLKGVWFPLRGGQYWEQTGFRANNAVLLHGPSGCGKTTLAHAVAGCAQVAFIPMDAQSVIGGTSGESEKNIRDFFDEAIRLAPCLLFIDEIDAIAGKRESANKAMEGRMVAEITTGMDRIRRQTPIGKNVVVLAATTRPEFLDPAIRRRFNTEIDIGMPNEIAREQILRAMTRGMALADDVDFKELAKLTPGYVGSDLQTLVNAAMSECTGNSLNDVLNSVRTTRSGEFGEWTEGQRDWLLLEHHQQDQWNSDQITFAHFKTAITQVQPASRREGFSTIPDTTWANVGALDEVRKKLEMSIIGPIKQPELFSKVGIKPAAGILLWGPPGCGKTLVAKAVANESKANFISIKGPELLNKYVGESERAVRQLFGRAKSSAPCILFFDEMDALVPKRDDSVNDSSARVVNALLTELDGVGDRSGIYVIGATNRPDIIDEAIRRPGRLGTSIYVGLPSAEDRVAILKTLYRNTITRAKADPMGAKPIADEREVVDLRKVALDRRCTGFTGADLGNLMHSAAQACLERAYMGQREGGVQLDPIITLEDWERALNEVKPSVKDIEKYDYLN
ncbi:P-loop containing nucleoside triphosphate hydrolase protein [Apodospora peruviana]|uniref:Peroxisomal ATPase PEX1 n=1 Tax=Apodospora peruviana TaxID=516989 RepID=A0AAE0HYL9_9PEZI|nr:P-loop containing nucleoside triphosphate hydrolase protein [Apodospora peruviana]